MCLIMRCEYFLRCKVTILEANYQVTDKIVRFGFSIFLIGLLFNPLFIITFAIENYVDRFGLLATTEKNAKIFPKFFLLRV